MKLHGAVRDRLSRPFTAGPSHRVDELDRLSPADQLESVADVVDPLLRNALITHNYWRVAQRFYTHVGTDNLVWPTFGSWASAQAGVYMRIGSTQAVRLATMGFGRRVTDLLADGNRLIFQDIAPPFWRFLDWLDETPVDERLALLGSAELQPLLSDRLALDPRPFEESPSGERLMVLAFEQYLRALHEADPDARAERIFIANVCVGLQEQTRVDGVLDELLDVDVVNDRLSIGLTPLRPIVRIGNRSVRRAWPAMAFALGSHAPRVRRHLRNYKRLLNAIVFERRLTQVLGTQLFMELDLGATGFDISDDVVAPAFARGLETISLGTTDFRAAFDLVSGWDRTPDSTEDSAALDWTDLSDRMNFIVDLFRGYQSATALNCHPLAR